MAMGRRGRGAAGGGGGAQCAYPVLAAAPHRMGTTVSRCAVALRRTAAGPADPRADAPTWRLGLRRPAEAGGRAGACAGRPSLRVCAGWLVACALSGARRGVAASRAPLWPASTNTTGIAGPRRPTTARGRVGMRAGRPAPQKCAWRLDACALGGEHRAAAASCEGWLTQAVPRNDVTAAHSSTIALRVPAARALAVRTRCCACPCCAFPCCAHLCCACGVLVQHSSRSCGICSSTSSLSRGVLPDCAASARQRR